MRTTLPIAILLCLGSGFRAVVRSRIREAGSLEHRPAVDERGRAAGGVFQCPADHAGDEGLSRQVPPNRAAGLARHGTVRYRAKLPDGASKEEIPRMLQSLLAER